MAMTINTNVVSLNSQRNLSLSGSSLSTSMQRLSSGLRVNSAKDDAAGLAISERMRAQSAGLTVAARNANDGISMAQTAEGALGKIGDMLQRQRELAVQSANATNSSSDRDALQAELSQLTSEIDRVAKTTSFNGRKLLDGNFSGAAFQVGADAGNNITVSGIPKATAEGLGNVTFGATVSKAVDLNKLGGLDQAQTLNIQVGDDKSVLVSVKAAGNAPERMGQIVAAINEKTSDTGVTAFLQTDAATGGFQIAVKSEGTKPVTFSGSVVDTLKEASFAGVRAYGHEAELGQLKEAMTGFRADASQASAQAVVGAANALATKLEGFDAANGEHTGAAAEMVDVATAMNAEASKSTFSAEGFKAAAAGLTKEVTSDNHTAVLDKKMVDAESAMANLSGQSSEQEVQDAIDGLSQARQALGQTELKSQVPAEVNDESIASLKSVVAKEQDVLGMNVIPEDVGGNRGIAGVDIRTQDGAWNAIQQIDSAIDQVNASRGDLGALQTRFEKSIENIDIQNENISAAKGRIVDADFATETANLSRAQILQQAGTAMVAQANQLPQSVLSLLR